MEGHFAALPLKADEIECWLTWMWAFARPYATNIFSNEMRFFIGFYGLFLQTKILYMKRRVDFKTYSL